MFDFSDAEKPFLLCIVSLGALTPQRQDLHKSEYCPLTVLLNPYTMILFEPYLNQDTTFTDAPDIFLN